MLTGPLSYMSAQLQASTGHQLLGPKTTKLSSTSSKMPSRILSPYTFLIMNSHGSYVQTHQTTLLVQFFSKNTLTLPGILSTNRSHSHHINILVQQSTGIPLNKRPMPSFMPLHNSHTTYVVKNSHWKLITVIYSGLNRVRYQSLSAGVSSFKAMSLRSNTYLAKTIQ